MVNKGRIDEAFFYYDDGDSSRTPSDARAYTDRGNAWYAKKEYDKAIADYDKAIELDPKNATAYTNRGNAWYAKKEYDKAIADYDKAIGLDPKYRLGVQQPRQRLERQEGVRQGHRRLRQGDRLDPKDASAYNNRGNAWYAKKEYDKAIADYNEAIRLDPKIRRRRTTTAATPGTPRRSTTRPSPTTTRRSDSTPRTPSAYNNRGNAWYAKKEYDKAIADYDRGHPARPQVRPGVQQPRHRLVRQEGVRQGHRRLRRGDPPRPQVRPGVQQPRLALGHLPRREVPRRQEGRRVGHPRLRVDRLEGRRLLSTPSPPPTPRPGTSTRRSSGRRRPWGSWRRTTNNTARTSKPD